MRLRMYLIFPLVVSSFAQVQSSSRSHNNGKIKRNAIHLETEATTAYMNKRSDVPDIDGSCEMYTGNACIEYVGNQMVYIPYPMTQQNIEEKLRKALLVIDFSRDISESCLSYTKPSICYSTFQICRNVTKNSNSRELFDMLNEVSSRNARSTYNSSPEPGSSKIISQSYGNVGRKKDLNHRLRRICRDECELLENVLCTKEYAIAKRHPHIGLQLPLIECSDLPKHGTKEAADCLSVGISTESDVNEKEYCYWGSGVSYRGTVKTSAQGHQCLKWGNQMVYEMGHHGLSSEHSYCRNPRSEGEKPWCYVSRGDKIEKEVCDIPECVKSLWVFVAIGLVLTTVLLVSLMSYFYCNKNKKVMRQPNFYVSDKMMNGVECDANIYDGNRTISRNEPIEMSSLLAGPSNLPIMNGTLGKCSTISSRSSESNRVPKFAMNNVVFMQELGEGAFGKVYKGELKIDKKSKDRIFVAIKTLKENASIKTQTDFKREVELMSDLRHPNIICLIGVVFTGEPMCMLFEYMTEGDLHEFLIRNSPKSENAVNYENLHMLKQPEFLYISKQISAGMEYLASNHYVHRDLAARNCLVGENLTVKISDFGLSRDIYSSDYYRVQSKSLLPVRWMPPESILYGKFTTESDVWSFGVVLWEIFSYGLQPYYGYNNQEVIDMIRARQLLPCPEECPPQVYTLMTQCWNEVANMRPMFVEVNSQLQHFYATLVKHTLSRREKALPPPVNSIHSSPVLKSVHTSPVVVKKDMIEIEQSLLQDTEIQF